MSLTDYVGIAIGRDAPEDYLSQYGVPGMKWGVRKRRNKASSAPVDPEDVTISKDPKTGRLTGSGGRSHPPSKDAVNAVALRQKAKASGRDSLSNKEIQEIVTRLDLEAKYARAVAATAPPKGAGRKFLEAFIKSEGEKALKTGKPPGIIQAIMEVSKNRAAKKAAGAAATAAGSAATAAAVRAIGGQVVKSTVVK